MTDKPKTWSEMTPEEKGALLLARHEGKTIQFIRNPNDDFLGWTAPSSGPGWLGHVYYRVKPEPKRETVTLHGYEDACGVWSLYCDLSPNDTHRLTFDLIDGEPDCNSVKMERIK